MELIDAKALIVGAKIRYRDNEAITEALNMAIDVLLKQIPFELTERDEETLTGICNCGRVTEIIDGEHYCKYCGQRVY
jgi:hypothetical protein